MAIDWSSLVDWRQALNWRNKVESDEDVYQKDNEFTAQVLTPLIQATPKELAGALGIVIGTKRSEDIWKFKGRIRGANSPHAFLPDPCDPAFADDPKLLARLVALHTTFYGVGIKDFDEVELNDQVKVALRPGKGPNTPFDLQIGQGLKKVNTPGIVDWIKKLGDGEDKCEPLTELDWSGASTTNPSGPGSFKAVAFGDFDPDREAAQDPHWEGISFMPVPYYTEYEEGTREINIVTIHTVEGGTYGAEGVGVWFQVEAGTKGKPKGGGASSHYAIGLEGEIVQFVDEKDKSWAEGNYSYNNRSVSIEHCGFASDPDNPGYPGAYTDAQLKASAKLTATICEKYDIPVVHGDPGIIGHVDVPNQTHWDPGVCLLDPGSDTGHYQLTSTGAGSKAACSEGWDWDKYLAMVKSAKKQLSAERNPEAVAEYEARRKAAGIT